VVVGW